MKVGPGLVFFVTGGAQGLSKAFVQRVHAKGAKVAVADISKEALGKLE